MMDGSEVDVEPMTFAGCMLDPGADVDNDEHDEPMMYAKSMQKQVGSELSRSWPQIVTEGEAPFRIVDVNELWLDVCGFRRKDVMGNTLRIVQGQFTDFEHKIRPMMSCVRRRESTSSMFINYTKSGEPFMNHVCIDPIHAANVKLCLATTISVDKFGVDAPPTSFDSRPRGSIPVPVLLRCPPIPGQIVQYRHDALVLLDMLLTQDAMNDVPRRSRRGACDISMVELMKLAGFAGPAINPEKEPDVELLAACLCAPPKDEAASATEKSNGSLVKKRESRSDGKRSDVLTILEYKT